MSMFKKKNSLQNPDRIIAPNSIKVKDLAGKDLKKIMNIFKDRINEFYIKPIKYLVDASESDYGIL